ncbi:transcriptional regulator SlyA [Nocardia otitidiscaviarum]|uniref:Transcriptional regulator SlyA n=1 Tax=Nocardia otitidiscaviarum TaxID=1823 RepID=A0A379JHS9_9NOCA|nr:MarR family transcriptional regulator [Nocardia otitidiscaviarum]MBF6177167.1 MarR family transcriptional regulator [Nocardia otitidiscaviarum]MBF6236342.1 MarR family transcriptional regulator [Nocardia otitidiscaviarum]SUD48025.1 transcriptional regulator SlyA [Nocardia otitidiscaviarum]
MPEVKRPDLAAMLAPLGRALVQAELPILERNGLSMWGYSVLLGLGEDPVYTQAALAKRINADKTRIIAVLDDLQRRGLITRTPDPADRRARLLSLTPEGRAIRDRAQREIQEREERLLSQLTPADRTAFLRALQRLSDAVRDQPD